MDLLYFNHTMKSGKESEVVLQDSEGRQWDVINEYGESILDDLSGAERQRIQESVTEKAGESYWYHRQFFVDGVDCMTAAKGEI